MLVFLYEIKKNYLKLYLLIFIILFLVLNAFISNTTIHRQMSGETIEYISAYNTISNYLSGLLTEEKAKFIISEKNRLNTIIQSGDYNTHYDPSNTYTGYVFSDNNLFNNLYNDISYCYNYRDYSNEIRKEAISNKNKYLIKGNESLATKYEFMADSFANRQILYFYNTKGWYSYFNYSFSNLMVILLIIIGCSSIFSKEKEYGMNNLLKTTSLGGNKIIKHKIHCLILYSLFITLTFSLEDYLIFKHNYFLSGLHNPVYSIPQFSQTGLNITILQTIILNFVTKCIGVFIISILTAIISSLAKSDLMALFANFFVFIINIFVFISYKKYSIISLFNSLMIIQNFSIKTFLGITFDELYFTIIIGITITIFLIIICYIINSKKTFIGKAYEKSC